MTDMPAKHLPISQMEGLSLKVRSGVQQAQGQERGCLLFPGEAPQIQPFCISREALRLVGKNMQSLKKEML